MKRTKLQMTQFDHSEWDLFSSASRELYSKSPDKTRCVLKYRHKEKALVVKVTDDKVCLKFQTDQQADIKKIEKMCTWFLEQMSSPDLE